MDRNLSDLPVSSGDPFWPLRFLDARFEPRDPLFDLDEIEDEQDELPRRRRKKPSRAAILAAAIAAAGCVARGSPAIHASDSILVQLEPGAAPPEGRADPEKGPPIVALESLAPDGEAPLLRLPLEPGTDAAKAAEQLERAPGVQFAEPVYIYQASRMPNDPRHRDQWALTKIEANQAWARTVGDRSVTVAVIDDGVALDHPDLQSNLWTNPQEIPGNGEDDDGDGIVDDWHGADFVDGDGDPSPAPEGEARWHGSHVSGTIGAAGDNHLGVVGVNWNVSIMAVRGLGPRGGRSDDLARSIDYAVDHGARVINASWGGGGRSQALARAIERAGRRGALFVAAAGNGSGRSPDFPAGLDADNVLSVGATTPDDLLATFSNRGSRIVAPGVGILSTTAPGRYERYDGTSMAAPHVSGAAALLWAAHPEASLEQVARALLEGAEHGRLNVAQAFDAFEMDEPAPQALALSRASLTFRSRAFLTQTVSIRTQSGAPRKWRASADRKWIKLGPAEGDSPARISISVDRDRLAPFGDVGTVRFVDDDGQGPTLQVEARPDDSLVAVTAGSCEMKDGALHARAGAGCSLQAAEGESAAIRWTLPGGRQVAGSHLYAWFARRGRFEMTLGAGPARTDAIPVVIE
ncbi:MAG: hypothetical protein E6J78_03725 [Deltaproteobacteria bacterium]|nr:MAG: hypothetical protein E6J78_03725 [Deltaproteobacteria bacterium]